jgi:hypothetical protein
MGLYTLVGHFNLNSDDSPTEIPKLIEDYPVDAEIL